MPTLLPFRCYYPLLSLFSQPLSQRFLFFPSSLAQTVLLFLWTICWKLHVCNLTDIDFVSCGAGSSILSPLFFLGFYNFPSPLRCSFFFSASSLLQSQAVIGGLNAFFLNLSVKLPRCVLCPVLAFLAPLWSSLHQLFLACTGIFFFHFPSLYSFFKGARDGQ